MSWNSANIIFCYPRYVTLHVSVWVEIPFGVLNLHHKKSRSTWACELKCFSYFYLSALPGHAPRERVSWNAVVSVILINPFVTLHVSVWVEIPKRYYKAWSQWSRSTWACELKFEYEKHRLCYVRHAPRERVSWNDKIHILWYNLYVTLHVSVWVEIGAKRKSKFKTCVTLHVSVWVEMTRFLNLREKKQVTLHVSVWVEIEEFSTKHSWYSVTLHVSVWVEIFIIGHFIVRLLVTLHVSVWVEIVILWRKCWVL